MNEDHWRFQRILREAAQYRVLRRIFETAGEETDQHYDRLQPYSQLIELADLSATAH